MKLGHDGVVPRHLQQLFDGESVAGMAEVQLLERFVSRRDEPAFAALVARHGPMVYGVCRRLLGDPHDVEDAFQATFLVLVRRAGTLRDRERLAPWLFGVARKVARRARDDRSRRHLREKTGGNDLGLVPAFDDHRVEQGRGLVEEIERLPRSLRDPLILCCCEGLSYDDAAERLRCSVAAVRGRLFRARERLRVRLARRGLAPVAGTLAAWSAPGATTAGSVPLTLLESTTQAALGLAQLTGQATIAGTVPAAAAWLAEGVTRTMIATQWKVAASAILALGVVSGASVMAGRPKVYGLVAQGPAPASAPLPTLPPESGPQLPAAKGSDTVPPPTAEQPAKTIAPSEAAPAKVPLADPGNPFDGIQNPPPATPASVPPSDAQRMQALESKLDRLLQALEGSQRGTLSSQPSSYAAPPPESRPEPEPARVVPDDRPAQPVPPQTTRSRPRNWRPSDDLQPLPPPGNARSRPAPAPAPAPTPAPAPQLVKSPFELDEAENVNPLPVARTPRSGGTPQTIPGRIDALEERLGQFENRIATIERMLGIKPAVRSRVSEDPSEPGDTLELAPINSDTIPGSRVYPAPTPPGEPVLAPGSNNS